MTSKSRSLLPSHPYFIVTSPSLLQETTTTSNPYFISHQGYPRPWITIWDIFMQFHGHGIFFIRILSYLPIIKRPIILNSDGPFLKLIRKIPIFDATILYYHWTLISLDSTSSNPHFFIRHSLLHETLTSSDTHFFRPSLLHQSLTSTDHLFRPSLLQTLISPDLTSSDPHFIRPHFFRSSLHQILISSDPHFIRPHFFGASLNQTLTSSLSLSSDPYLIRPHFFIPSLQTLISSDPHFMRPHFFSPSLHQTLLLQTLTSDSQFIRVTSSSDPCFIRPSLHHFIIRPLLHQSLTSSVPHFIRP